MSNATSMTTKLQRARKRTAKGRSLKRGVRPRRGQLYQGIEWLACWLLDNEEGGVITEENLRPWAAKAWLEHLQRSNAKLTDGGCVK